jgi:signal transduction histidine kinase
MLRVGIPAAIVVTLLLAFGVTDVLELPARDLALRLLPSRPARNTVVVAIDEQSLRELGPWPWPRPLLARIVDRIAAAGARGLVVDVLLAEPREGDAELSRAMQRLPTLAVAVLDEKREWLLPAFSLRGGAMSAHGNFELDRDGILRRLASTKQSRELSKTALSLEAASIVKSGAVPIGRSIAPAFRTPPRAIPRISAAEVLRGGQAILPVQRAGEKKQGQAGQAGLPALHGKLVFFGPTALAIGDRVLTPTSNRDPDPGVTVHAAATESILRGEILRVLPPIVSGAIAGLLVWFVVTWRRASIAMIAVLALGALLLDRANVVIPFVTLLAAIAIAGAGAEAARLAANLRQSRAVSANLTARREEDVEAKRMLAHELRTPLQSMRGLSELLARFELDDAERRRVASLLELEAGKLQSMVHVLLDLERISTRDFETSSALVDLNDVVEARIELLRAGTDRALLVSGAPGTEVRADAALLERMIDNLVGNALKYTPAPNAVTVRVARRDGAALLEVEDRGPGISNEERAKIFNRFFRGSSAAGSQGLGLGLSLVAEIARWHGGAVDVERGAEGGSLFRVSLPHVRGA